MICVYMKRMACAVSILAFGAASAQVQDTNVSFGYDEAGNLTSVTRPLSRSSTYTYDPLGRLKQENVSISGATLVTKLGYDNLGQLTWVTDPRNLTTNYVVDGLSNKTSQSSPDTASTTYTRDEEGRVLTKTDARGKVTSYTYDALGRLTQITYASGTPTIFEYDGGVGGPVVEVGQLTKISDASGSTNFTHDVRGRILARVQTVTAGGFTRTLSTAYEYETAGIATGKLIAMTYPSGMRINYSYDEAGRVSALTMNPGDGNGGTDKLTQVPFVQNIGYSPTGGIRSWEWGNGLGWATYSRTFDLDGRPTSYPIDATGTVRTVLYNAANLIVGYVHSGGSNPDQFNQTFDFDLADRLTVETRDGLTTTYVYDANGNRTQQTGPTGTFAFSTVSNQLMSASVPTARSCSYDAASNRTSDGVLSFSYGDDGRLATSTGNAMQAYYYYNGKGERVLKAVNGTLTYFAYDETGHTVGEYLADQRVEVVYLGDIPLMVVSAGASYAVMADHLNTPLTLTSTSSGAIIWDWRTRDAFGATEPILSNGQGLRQFNLRFPGQMADNETKLFYNYFRDYDPRTGRYLQSDPIGLEGGVNTYAYVGSNPTIATDPLGLLEVHIWNFRDMRNVGHASMTLNDGTYISWWPRGSDADLFNSVTATNMSRIVDDIRNEGRPPDRTITVEGLDEPAIRKWWEAFKRDKGNNYSFLGQNCAATVAGGLDAGGGGSAASKGTWGRPTPPVWTPEAVGEYAGRIAHPGPKLPVPKRAPGWN